MSGLGLTARNRQFVATLNRNLSGPFTIQEASVVTSVDRARTSRLLRHLADQGWVKRIQRGLYMTVPLEALEPENWDPDPWAIAAATMSPGYIGGWTALHHWDLTDQLFSTVLFVTSRAVPRRERTIGGARFELRHRNGDSMFGLRRVWRGRTPINISDKEKTLVDCLAEPSLGAGVRHIAEALEAYAREDGRSWEKVIEFGDRLGNRALFKRLGYLGEVFDLGDLVVDESRKKVSAGVSLLDPSSPDRGPIVTRWNLRVNVDLGN